MHAPSLIAARKRTPLRLIVAVAGSVGLHAAALGLHGPAGAGAPVGTAFPPLTAFLAPADPPASITALADAGTASVAEPGLGNEQANAGLPSPDRWFKRSELDATAVPDETVTIEYPDNVKARGAARVQVRLFIDERGIVRKVTLERPGPERAFEEAAARAWHGVRFSPALKNGVAVKSQQVIEVDFPAEIAFR